MHVNDPLECRPTVEIDICFVDLLELTRTWLAGQGASEEARAEIAELLTTDDAATDIETWLQNILRDRLERPLYAELAHVFGDQVIAVLDKALDEVTKLSVSFNAPRPRAEVEDIAPSSASDIGRKAANVKQKTVHTIARPAAIISRDT
jgi:hypothetical protein